MRCLCLQTLFHLFKDGAEAIEIDLTAKAIKDLNKAAHVRSFKPVRQIHIHIDMGHGMLPVVRFIEDSYRIANRFYTNFFNINLTGIKLTLNVFHC